MEALVQALVAGRYNGLLACTVPDFQSHIVKGRLFSDMLSDRRDIGLLLS